MKSDVAHCQSRVKCLRERYCKEKKLLEMETRSGAGKSFKKPWPLMEAMSFLDDHIKPRKTYSNFPDLGNNSQSDPSCSAIEHCVVEYDGIFDIGGTEVESDNSSDVTAFSPPAAQWTPTLASPSIERRGKKRCSSTPQDELIEKHLKLVAESASKITEKMQNSAEIFFSQFVAESLSQLPEDIKDECTLKIMTTLVEAKEKARRRNNL
ncbi:uncharacterized protein [Anabrus simplex]|uniref:uncharacterized protein n=1 Tax=Anabrus simplex TaxID=316456 RepID=UPI0035A2CD7D